jgi:hypothetical protein
MAFSLQSVKQMVEGAKQSMYWQKCQRLVGFILTLGRYSKAFF